MSHLAKNRIVFFSKHLLIKASKYDHLSLTLFHIFYLVEIIDIFIFSFHLSILINLSSNFCKALIPYAIFYKVPLNAKFSCPCIYHY